MPITLKTGVASNPSRQGRRGEIPHNVLFRADFCTEQYAIGGTTSAFDDMVSLNRTSSVYYFDPKTVQFVSAGPNQPVFFDARGRRGLNLAGGPWARLVGSPTGAGVSTQAYTENLDNTRAILIIYGGPKAWARVSGDISATFAGDSFEALRGRPVYLTLTPSATRNFTIEVNDDVLGWRLTGGAYEDFGRTSLGPPIGASTLAEMSQGCLDVLNGAQKFILRGKLRMAPHKGAAQTWSDVFQVSDANGNWFGFDVVSGVWRARGTQAIATPEQPVGNWWAPLTRYITAEQRAEDIEFKWVVDKSSRRSVVSTAAGRSNGNILMPDMDAIASISIGKIGTQNPAMLIDYVLAEGFE